jgi:hypothetical protein
MLSIDLYNTVLGFISEILISPKEKFIENKKIGIKKNLLQITILTLLS